MTEHFLVNFVTEGEIIPSQLFSLQKIYMEKKIVGREFITPLFYEDPPWYYLSPLLFKFCLEPSPLQPPPPLLFLSPCRHCSFWLHGWSRQIWWVILLNEIKDQQMSSLDTSVTEGLCVFDATWHQTDHLTLVWLFACTLIWYHTHK